MRENKFRHNFRNSPNAICNCGNAIESTKHYLLLCSNFKNERQSLLQSVRIVNLNLLSMNEDALTHLLLYGENTLTNKASTFLLNSIIEYITLTKHFSNLLFCNRKVIPLGQSSILNYNSFLIFVFSLDFNLFSLCYNFYFVPYQVDFSRFLL